jgi:hypothetical protein
VGSLLLCQTVSEKVWNLSLLILWCYETRLLSAIHQCTCPFSGRTSTSWFLRIWARSPFRQPH